MNEDLLAGLLFGVSNQDITLPFPLLSRRSTYWVAVFGVARLFFRAEEPKNCTTSLDEFHTHFLAGLLFGVATVGMKELHYLFE